MGRRFRDALKATAGNAEQPHRSPDWLIMEALEPPLINENGESRMISAGLRE
jgi:hypothetical protein